MTDTSKDYLDSLFGLEDKTAVVVGGTGVLCGAMARGLWNAGCRVVLAGRDEAKADAHRAAWNASKDHVRYPPLEPGIHLFRYQGGHLEPDPESGPGVGPPRHPG